jgi:hypothetical protein
MIEFSSSVRIHRPPEAIFHFLSNLHSLQQAGDSPVLSIEATTAGPPRVGFKYSETVRILPFYKGEFNSEIVVFDPPQVLELVWTGPAMTGRDRYELNAVHDGTELVHKKWVSCPGVLGVIEPLLRKPLFPRLLARLEEIKRSLEQEHDSEAPGAP